MVDSISMDGLSLSSSNPQHCVHGHSNHQFSSYHHAFATNSSNSGLSGSNHGSRNSGGLNGSLHHTRASSHRNKSFTKPRISPCNPVYDPLSSNSSHSTRSTGSFLHSYKKPDLPQKGQYIAMDCEMVGTVSGESIAARVVLIDWRGRVVLDSYMRPEVEITDYRTFVSGITEENLKNAPSFVDVVGRVKEFLHDKILVGHGVDNDLRALGIAHPWLMTRDTAYYQPFMRQLDINTHHRIDSGVEATTELVWGPRKLKDLAKEKLQREIQVVGVSHCPVEDAAAALDLYKSHRPRWEACMSSEERQQHQYSLQMAAARAYELSTLQDFNAIGSPVFTSVLTPPSRTKVTRQSSDLSMSTHSYFRHSEPRASVNTNYRDPKENLSMLSTGLLPSFYQQGIMEGHSYHSRMDSSLDSNSFHGFGRNQNRKQLHRSCSLSGDSPGNQDTQRQSSLKYAPPGLQRQKSLDNDFLISHSPSNFDYRRENKENIPVLEPGLFQGGPPPGFAEF
jgi:RNA exonuclease 4